MLDLGELSYYLAGSVRYRRQYPGYLHEAFAEKGNLLVMRSTQRGHLANGVLLRRQNDTDTHRFEAKLAGNYASVSCLTRSEGCPLSFGIGLRQCPNVEGTHGSIAA